MCDYVNLLADEGRMGELSIKQLLQEKFASSSAIPCMIC